MINLIPNQEKKKKVKDFYFRLAVVFISMLGFCVIVGIVAILPSYFLSTIEKNLASAELLTQKNQPQTELDQDLAVEVNELSRKLTTIDDAQKNRYLVSEKIVRAVTLEKMSDIKLTKIIFEDTEFGDPAGDGAGKKVTVLGMAPSRERLHLFRQALEDSAAFGQVDLPISNFVKGSNIEFSLSLIPS